MRSLFIMLLVLATPLVLFSQESAGRPPVSISYFSNYGFQPGIKVGTAFSLAGDSTRQWLISPQLGVFTNPSDDTHTLLNLEAGLKRPKPGKNAYTTMAIGLGYLHQSKLQSFSVNLGSGQTGDRQRVGDNFVMPSVSYEYGWATHRKISWFGKCALGTRLLGRNEHSMMLLLEFGIKL
ncbi:MAG: hypothetical protein HEP71_33935 [Roseivirga sp.]|nr:hypothetical protein [Roseivirga sp.]